MAKRRRKSTTAKRRVSTAVTRRRSSAVGKRRKVTRSKKGIPFIGEISLKNPLIGGAVGGFAASLLKDEVEDTLFGTPTDPADDKDWKVWIQPYAKGLAISGVAVLAKNQGYDQIAAGMAGAAAAYTRDKMKDAGIFSEGGGKRRRIGNYVGNRLLADPSLLSETAMLSAYR